MAQNAPALLRAITEDWSGANKDLEENLENAVKIQEEASLAFAEAEQKLDSFQFLNLTAYYQFKAHGGCCRAHDDQVQVIVPCS